MIHRGFFILLLQLFMGSAFIVPQKNMSPSQINPLKFAVTLGEPATDAQMACFLNSGYQAVVIRVADSNGNYEPGAMSNINSATRAGLAIELYMRVSATSSTPAYSQFENIYDTLTKNGFKMKRIWILVDAYSAWNSDQNENAIAMQALFERITLYGIQAGVFTDHNDWNDIMGSGYSLAANNISLWYTPYVSAAAAETPTDFSDFHTIGSSNTPLMKRYQWGESLCGFSAVSRDVFDPLIMEPLSTLLPMAYFMWHNITPSMTQLNCLINNNYKVLVVRVTSGSGFYTSSVVPTINNAFNVNLPIELYMEIVPVSSIPMTQQFQNVYDRLRSDNIRFTQIWIMVAYLPYFQQDANQNVAAIQSFIQRANQFKVEIGIFTSKELWSQITGSYTGFAATSPLWYGHSDINGVYESPNNFLDYIPFGNWNYPSMKKYSAGQVGDAICGLDGGFRVVFNYSLPIGQNSVFRI